MVAKLHIIIGSGCGGTRETERSHTEVINNLSAHLSGKGFENTGFIKNYTAPIDVREFIELFIVGYVNAVIVYIVCGISQRYVDAELLALVNGLRGYGERS